jgi:hypothetical protein
MHFDTPSSMACPAIKNWKTTIIGLIVIGVGVIHALHAHAIDSEALAEFSSGAGLIMASDGNSKA